jgi:hypothetical protein
MTEAAQGLAQLRILSAQLLYRKSPSRVPGLAGELAFQPSNDLPDLRISFHAVFNRATRVHHRSMIATAK